MRVSRTRLWTQRRWQTPARPCRPVGGGLRVVLSQWPGLGPAVSSVCGSWLAGGPSVYWGARQGCVLQGRHAEQSPAEALRPSSRGHRFRSAAWSRQRGDAGASPPTPLDTAAAGRRAESCLWQDACSESVAHGVSASDTAPEQAGQQRLSGSSPRCGAFGGPEPAHTQKQTPVPWSLSRPHAATRCLLPNIRHEALAWRRPHPGHTQHGKAPLPSHPTFFMNGELAPVTGWRLWHETRGHLSRPAAPKAGEV